MPQYDIDTLAVRAARGRTMAALFGTDAASPSTIAGYSIRDVLGRGAMGVVYLAHDERLDRSVALKLLDPGRRHDPRARASLVEEAKQIARVQHPNVVAVYEVGSHEGDTFLAMEYVAGPTLREWTLGSKHTREQILHVFIDAGRGLAAVHDAGLLHRDFKPSNVLVTASGLAKVADFGLARRDDSVVTSPDDRSSSSGDGTAELLAGTPAYMAPEQVHGATTARSDQFAFGVALLEALCGDHPFDRVPAFTLEPEDASARLDAIGRARLPGWLFAIVRRAVEWDPEARWPDMATLVAALESDPARRRGRLLAGIAGGVVLVLAAGGAYAWSRARAERCSGAREQIAAAWGEARRDEVHAALLATDVPYADAAWDRTAAVLDDYAQEWIGAHSEACAATTVRGEQSAEVMDLRMACLQRAKTKLGAVTDVLASADANVVARTHEVVSGLRPLSRCTDIPSLRAEVEPPLPEHADAIERGRELLAQSRSQADAGLIGDAERSLREAEDALATTDYGPAQTELALAEGFVLEQLGRYDESETALREAVESAARWRQWDELGEAVMQLIFVVGTRMQRPEDGLRYRELAIGLASGDPRMTANIDTHLALVFLAQAKYEEAELANRRALAAFVEAFGSEHLHVATARNNLAAVLWQRGNVDEAEAQVREALDIGIRMMGADHPDAVRSRNNLALLLMARGHYDEAEAESRDVLDRWERMYGPSHPEVAAAHNNIGLVLHARGHSEEAEAEFREGLSIRERTLGAEHASVAESRTNLADVLVERHAYAEAIEQANAAIVVFEATVGSAHPHVAAAHHVIARALVGLGDLDGAATEHRRALELREQALGADHVDVAQSCVDLADVLLRNGKPDEALPLAERGWSHLQRDGVLPKQRAQAASVLARARSDARRGR